MIRRQVERVRRLLKKSLVLGGALLFVTPVAGCWEFGGVGDAGVKSLTGPPDELASACLPDIPFPDADPAEYHFVGDMLAVSIREVLLVFADTTTVGQANQLLSEFEATITGGLPEAGLLLIDVPASGLSELMGLLTALNADPRIEIALMEMGGTPNAIPSFGMDYAIHDWMWDVPSYPHGPFMNANWGLEACRAPQLWNLADHVQRIKAKATSPVDVAVDVAIVDVEFDGTHADVDIQQIMPPPLACGQSGNPSHGTRIAGIIGANWGNGFGIDGINPWLRSIYAKRRVFTRDFQTWGRELHDIAGLVQTHPNIRAVNVAHGVGRVYIYMDESDNNIVDNSISPTEVLYGDLNANGRLDDCLNCDPLNPPWPEWGADRNNDGIADGVDLDGQGGDDTWAEVMNHFGDLYHSRLTRIGGKVIFVATAGNHGRHYSAMYDSPLGNAAARFGAQYLAVEAIDEDNDVPESYAKGIVGAPGENIFSTACGNGYNTRSGTSYAAPYVTGLVTALWALDPDMSRLQVSTLLTATDFTVQATGTTAPRIDAFAAAMGIDILRENKILQHALVDVDDGTPDGNQRVDPRTGAVFDAIVTSDGLRGDKVIDMSDFRVFRDAYLQVRVEEKFLDKDGVELDVELDGPESHAKKDLNLDRPTIVSPFKENVFPRYDFNGDGKIGEWFVTAPFKQDPDGKPGENKTAVLRSAPGNLRDIDVLADPELWTIDSQQVLLHAASEHPLVYDPDMWDEYAGQEGWQPPRLLLADRNSDHVPDYLYSADVHIIVGNIPRQILSISILVNDEWVWKFWEHSTPPPGTELIVTVPVRMDTWIPRGAGFVAVFASAYDAGYLNYLSLDDLFITDARLGQDLVLELNGTP